MTTRYEYLQLLAPKITDELVTTNVAGVVSEWYNLGDRDGNLYGIWLGGATNVALGLALALPKRRVISLDGDGSMLMDLTVLPIIAHMNPSNLTVLVFDNGVYGCIPPGDLPTFTSGPTNLVEIARAAGIQNCRLVSSPAEFHKAIDASFAASGASFIVVKVVIGDEPLPYPTLDGMENKYRFIRYIERTEGVQILRAPGIIHESVQEAVGENVRS